MEALYVAHTISAPAPGEEMKMNKLHVMDHSHITYYINGRSSDILVIIEPTGNGKDVQHSFSLSFPFPEEREDKTAMSP